MFHLALSCADERALRWRETNLLSVNEERPWETCRYFPQVAGQEADACSSFSHDFCTSTQQVQREVMCSELFSSKNTSDVSLWFTVSFPPLAEALDYAEIHKGISGKTFHFPRWEYTGHALKHRILQKYTSFTWMKPYIYTRVRTAAVLISPMVIISTSFARNIVSEGKKIGNLLLLVGALWHICLKYVFFKRFPSINGNAVFLPFVVHWPFFIWLRYTASSYYLPVDCLRLEIRYIALEEKLFFINQFLIFSNVYAADINKNIIAQ